MTLGTFRPIAVVRAVIARTMLGGGYAVPEMLGAITLRPHQRSAASRLWALIDAHGGALLADRVGLGKTYASLAVAARFGGQLLVVAPASLRRMWVESLE